MNAKTKPCCKCKYQKMLSTSKTEMYCSYIEHTGKTRGCAIGEGCDKFEKRTNKKKNSHQVDIEWKLGGLPID